MISTAKLPAEPIVVVSIACSMEEYLAQKHHSHQRINDLLAQLTTSLFVIYDLTHVPNLGYSDILLWLDDYQQDSRPGSPLDPRLRSIIVGDNPIIQIWAKKVRQTLGVVIPTYDTLGEATAAIRVEVQNSQMVG